MAWNWDNDGYGGYPPYVSVAEKRRRAAAAAKKLEKGGRKLAPVTVEGRSIASTFWGKAWCENLESYSDYASRLPRGRSYARNGSVLDLQIERGVVTSLVAGSSVYKIKIKIEPLAKADWSLLKRQSAGKVGSLMDLLRGKLSGPVMEIMTRKAGGLFPRPYEIEFTCSCPDAASMCKHIAATLYGVGARLDQSPELLFTLRGVDHLELIAETTQNLADSLTAASGGADTLDESSLADVFGIEIEGSPQAVPASPKKPARSRKQTPAGKSPMKKKARPKPSGGGQNVVNLAAKAAIAKLRLARESKTKTVSREIVKGKNRSKKA